eukprot:3429903-Heterocapsa_arctica.AAC.1
MPDIINFLEAELRDFNMGDYTHKLRGQHPEARNGQFADTEIMTERGITSLTLHLDTIHQDHVMTEEIL